MESKKLIKIYWFDNNRNKCILKGKSVNCLKKELIESKGKVCYLCHNLFEKSSQLELEHKIPVETGGRIFCLSNLDLACIKCHKEKTIIDKKVINIIKKTGVLIKDISSSFLPLEDIRKLYLQLFEIIDTSSKNYKIWYYGQPEVDYLQLNDISNREDIKEGENGESR